MARPGRTPTQVHGAVDLEVTGDTRAVDQMLADFGVALQPDELADFLREHVHPIIEARARARFASEGDDVSGPWAQLKPYTQAMRKKGGFGPAHPINVHYGNLRAHILDRSPEAEPNAMGAVLYFPRRGGSKENLEKLKVAQIGSDAPRTPPRPVLGVNPNDLELVLQATTDHLARYQRGYSGGRLFP